MSIFTVTEFCGPARLPKGRVNDFGRLGTAGRGFDHDILEKLEIGAGQFHHDAAVALDRVCHASGREGDMGEIAVGMRCSVPATGSGIPIPSGGELIVARGGLGLGKIDIQGACGSGLTSTGMEAPPAAGVKRQSRERRQVFGVGPLPSFSSSVDFDTGRQMRRSGEGSAGLVSCGTR